MDAIQASGLADVSPEVREKLRQRALDDFYFFCKAVLNYRDMTPECHGKICTFVTNNEWRRKMTLQPRGHLKTSIVTVAHSLWEGTKDPGTSILIINEVEENAIEFLTKIKEFVTGNALYRALFPEVVPDLSDKKARWHAKYADLKRTPGMDYYGPTWQVMGVKGAPTSRHVRRIKFDDMFGEAASLSEAEANRCYSMYQKSDSLLVDPGRDFIDIIGTHWLPHDVYVRIPDEEGAVYLNSEATDVARVTDDNPTWLVWKRRCYHDDSVTPIWPERFTESVLRSIRRKQGSFHFALQYLNDPIAPDNVDFYEGNFRYWKRDEEGQFVIFNEDTQKTEVWNLEDLDVISLLDPAVGLKEHHSRTAIAVLACTPSRKVLVVEAWAKRCKKETGNPQDPGWLDMLFNYQRKFDPRACFFESVAFQKIIGSEIEDRNWREDVSINVQEIKLGGPREKSKPVRIRSVIGPVLERHDLYFSPYHDLLKDELIKHPMGQTSDLLDCLAHGIPRLIQPATAEERRSIRRYEDESWQNLGITGYGDNQRVHVTQDDDPGDWGGFIH